MRRKVVQHGPGTLTISLPARWAQDQGLAKGDEVDIQQSGACIVIGAVRGVSTEEKTIDVRGLAPEFIRKVISALYKRGYDSLRVTYESSVQLEAVQTVTNNGCIGFEIVDDTGTQLVIRNVSEPSPEEFKTLFRRVFHFLIAIGEETFVAAQRHARDAYPKLILRDKQVNKLTDFCRRVVNTRTQRTYDLDTAVFHILEQLEKIGDHYRHLNAALAALDESPSRPLLAQIQRASDAVRAYEDLFFKFTLQKAQELFMSCRAPAVRSQLPREAAATIFVSEIIDEIHNLTGSTLALHA